MPDITKALILNQKELSDFVFQLIRNGSNQMEFLVTLSQIQHWKQKAIYDSNYPQEELIKLEALFHVYKVSFMIIMSLGNGSKDV